MDESAGQGDDISGLWGTELSTGMAPALREPKPAANPHEENGHDARLVAIEQEVRGLLELIQRVESQLNLRLDRVEEQVTRMSDQLHSGRPQSDASSRRKAMARITEVIKPAKESLKGRAPRP